MLSVNNHLNLIQTVKSKHLCITKCVNNDMKLINFNSFFFSQESKHILIRVPLKRNNIHTKVDTTELEILSNNQYKQKYQKNSIV